MPTTVSLTQLGASRRDKLDRCVQAGLIKQGRVFALSLDPVRISLGDRWMQKRQQVWDAAERALEKRMPPPDVFMRIDDTTFLAAVASTDAYEAQVRCAEVLRGLLTFFLGRSADDDVALTRVSDLSGSSLSCEPVDLNAERSSFAPAASDRPRSPEDWVPPLGGRRALAGIHTVTDDPAAVDLEIVPVWRLDHGIIGAYRIQRVWRGLRPPSMAQAEAVDHATVDFLLPILEEYRREGGVFAIIAPLDFGVVMPTRPRRKLIGRWSEAVDLMRRVVILEMEGVDAGTPTGRIGETTAMLAPFFHSVMLQVSDQAVAIGALRAHGFNGVTIDTARLKARGRLGGLIGAVRRFTRNIMLLNAPEGLTDAVLKAAGVSHATRPDADAAAEPATVKPGASVPA